MAIRDFVAGPDKGLQHAEWQGLPNLVVVAGPNGSGKSTLLHTLYRRRAELAEPDTTVSYLGPHRGWRKIQLATATLSEFQPGFRSYLESDVVPGWQQYQPQGLQHVAAGQQRDPGGLDESFSFVKPAISKLENRQQQLLREKWTTQGGTIAPGDVPDLLEPLRAALRALLPHLELRAVDVSDDRNLRVLFSRVDGSQGAEVELDELSSGEKAAVGLILPFVEDEADRLAGIAPGAVATPTMIIDEPEAHLHPSLQVLFLDYLRELAVADAGQFILATHSPTILDALDEFFVLVPFAASPDGNQLRQVTDEAGRLDAMRSVTGSTHLLTRCRPIVFIEGERPPSRTVTDQRLVEMLIPESSGWVLVASQGRSEVARSAGRLRNAMAEEMPGVPVFALVDRDRAQDEDADYVISWPVAMVENLLLDPEAIWAVLEAQRDRLELGSSTDVERALRDIARERYSDEIRLRVDSIQKPVVARVSPEGESDLEAAIGRAAASIDEQLDGLRGPAVSAEFSGAQAAVEETLNEGNELAAFRGKEILRTFYDRHAKTAGFSLQAFSFSVASEVTRSGRIAAMVQEVVRRVEQFVPAAGVEAVGAAREALAGTEHEAAATDADDASRAARSAWEDPDRDPADLGALREGWMALASAVEPINGELAGQVRQAATELGVPSSTLK